MTVSKYDKMVATNKETSEKKIARAIAEITAMVQQHEKIAICELTKKTGLSRGFFYKNAVVRQELEKALNEQKGKSFVNPRKVVLDKAMEEQLKFFQQQVEKLKVENEKLKKENERLKKNLNKKELTFIKKL